MPITNQTDISQALYAKFMVQNDLVPENLPDEIAQVVQNLPTGKQALSAVALVSQYQAMMSMQMPTPKDKLTIHQPLPILDLPTLPDTLYQLSERIIEQINAERVYLIKFLELIHNRGYAIHPNVWFPSKAIVDEDFDFEGNLPDIYLPWHYWQMGEQSVENMTHSDLTLENWHDWYPSVRAGELRQIRQHDPDKALALIAHFAPKESAEKRLRLVGVLSVGLNDNDKEFLLSLHKDRSTKVVSLSKKLLARLGVFDDDDKLAHELHNEFHMVEGKLVAKHTKNYTRRNKRGENLAVVNIHSWAKLLGMSVGELALVWNFEKNEEWYNSQFLTNIINVLTDDELNQFLEQTLPYICKKQAYLWHIIRQRASVDERREFAKKMLVRQYNFRQILDFCPEILDMRFELLKATPPYKQLVADIQNRRETDSDFVHYYTSQNLMALGLMVSQEVATAILQDLFGLGVTRIDPALHILTLNAKLPKNE